MTDQSEKTYPPVTLQAGERWFCDYCGDEVENEKGVTNSRDLVYCSERCARRDEE